jgi:hypothetical protein
VKKLPVVKPSVVSYLHHAYKLAILETEDKARHYVVNNFLQVYSPGLNDPDVGMVVDFYCHDGVYPRYPFLTWAWMSGTLLGNLDVNKTQIVCAAIDSRHYVEATLDEFHIPVKSSYKQEHFIHQNLIFGYCKDKRLFYAVGFDNGLRFAEYTITFDEFEKAMQCNVGLALIGWAESAKFSNSQEYSPELIKAYLNDFIESRCSFIAYRPSTAVFGAATYEVAISLLEQENGRALNFLPWCVFYEHKKKLCSLAEYLAQERELIVSGALSQALKVLRDDFLELRNYLLEAKYYDTQVKIQSLRRNIEVITNSEADILRELAQTVS